MSEPPAAPPPPPPSWVAPAGWQTPPPGWPAGATPPPGWPGGAVPPPNWPGGPVAAGQDGWRRPLTIVFAVLVGLWLVTVCALATFGGWVTQQLYSIQGGTLPPSPAWLVPALAIGLLAGIPALVLALVPKLPGARAAGRAWATVSFLSVPLGILRAVVPLPAHVLYLVLLALVAGGAAIVVPRRRSAPVQPAPGRGEPAPGGNEPAPSWSARAPGGRGLAVAAGLGSLVPWLWVGALGGITETVAAGLAAVAVGVLARSVLDQRFWEPFGTHRSAWVRIAVGGLVAGVALAGLAAGTGAAGIALAELLVLPPLGFAAAGLRQVAGNPRPIGWLVGLAALGPLAFADPEEINIVIGLDDAPQWVLVAAVASLVVGLLFSLGYALSAGFGLHPRRPVSVGLAAVVGLAGVVVYAGPGHAGTYGDHLFVVLKQQADLSSLGGIADRDERLHTTYRRLVDTADRSQAGLRDSLRTLHLDFTPYYLVNAIDVAGDDATLAWLSGRPEVDRVLRSPRLRPIPEPAAPLKGTQPPPNHPQWNVSNLGADRVWQDFGVTGQNIVVGTSDSGVDGTHPAVRDGFRGGDDSWFDPWNHTRTPFDGQGHGTHTIATAVGRQNVGVAPGAQWVGCVNLARNLGNPANYLDCLQFMLAPFPRGADPFRAGRPERAPQVLTNSWGCPQVEGCDLRSLRPAVAALTAAGIFVVAAAGNSGPSCATITDPPAPYDDTLTVGAVDQSSRVTEFSSRGPAAGGKVKPDVVAPGAKILSALPGNGYGYLDGTSMAAPHVAGVVALMWSANPKLVGDIARTREILRTTTRPATAAGNPCGGSPDNQTGAGLVDAYRAVQAAKAVT